MIWTVVLTETFYVFYAMVESLIQYGLHYAHFVMRHPYHTIGLFMGIVLVYNFFLWMGFGQKRTTRLSTPYLNGAYYERQLREGIENPHQYYHQMGGPLHRPTYCNACSKLMAGITDDPLSCDVCGYAVHEHCLAKAETKCKAISVDPTDALDALGNTTQTTSSSSQTSISSRRRAASSSGDDQGLPSSPSHSRTRELRDASPSSTSQSTTSTRSGGNTYTPFPHHWMPGNHSTINDICLICAQPTGSLFGLSGLHCLWCQANVHDDCIAEMKMSTKHDQCSLGPLAKIIIPPTAVQPAHGYTISTARLAMRGAPLEAPSSSFSHMSSTMRAASTRFVGAALRLTTRSSSSSTSSSSKDQSVSASSASTSSSSTSKSSSSSSPSIPASASHGHASRHHAPISNPTLRTSLSLTPSSSSSILSSSSSSSSTHPNTSITSKGAKGRARSSSRSRRMMSLDTKDLSDDEHEHSKNESNDDGDHDQLRTNQRAATPLRMRSTRSTTHPTSYVSTSSSLSSRLTGERRSLGSSITGATIDDKSKSARKREGSVSNGPFAGTLTKEDLEMTRKRPTDTVAGRRSSTSSSDSDKVKHDLNEKKEDDTPPKMWDFNVPSSISPLIVFINRKSGGNKGVQLLHEFLGLLNPIQVWDLADGGPWRALSLFSDVPRLQVLVCGGDGTVSWVLSQIDRLERQPAVAILPLGTGNDLAQVLGWGGTCPTGPLRDVLQRVAGSRMTLLDRWNAQVKPLTNPNPSSSSSSTSSSSSSSSYNIRFVSRILPHRHISTVSDPSATSATNAIVNNYMGIGIDAIIAHYFHNMRDNYPDLFFSQFMNKVWYAQIGSENYFFPRTPHLLAESKVQVIVDGNGLDLTGMQGVCFLNIKSFGGGINFWGHQPAEPNFREPQYDDQLLEVIGFRSSLHMGQIQIGVTMPHRLAQGRHIIVRTQGPLPFQVDGEPWGVKSACEVHVSLRTQTLMLTPAADEKESAVVSAFSNLMHWAEETRVITDAQKATLMREFAKRHAKIAPSSAFYQPVLTSGNDYD